jgi:monofunctional biosynthetic peptidoglycan transglycosylase
VSDDQNVDPRASQKDAIGALGSDLDRAQRKRFQLPHVSMPKGLGGIALSLVAALVIVPVIWTVLYSAINPPGTILMLERWLGGANIRHQNVKEEEISPHLIRAVLAAEDARFCEHKGFDMEAIQAAYAANMKASNQKKGKVRGGSTISQQTAKNLFLWPERSFVRKGAEAYFTFLIEHIYPKRRIMQHYLNIAEFGPGLFGAQAASRAYFNVSVGELSPHQAALLAAVLPSPNKWSASQPGPYVRRRAASIEARMYGIHAQNLDACVLSPNAAAPPRRKGAPSTLPPLEALPPDVAIASDAPVMVDTATPADAATSVTPVDASTFQDGELEAPAAPQEPASAPEAAPAEAPSATPVQ